MVVHLSYSSFIESQTKFSTVTRNVKKIYEDVKVKLFLLINAEKKSTKIIIFSTLLDCMFTPFPQYN